MGTKIVKRYEQRSMSNTTTAITTTTTKTTTQNYCEDDDDDNDMMSRGKPKRRWKDNTKIDNILSCDGVTTDGVCTGNWIW
jgi:hypothetical protein